MVVGHRSPEDRLEIQWDPPGFYGGVTIRRRVTGNRYKSPVLANSLANQAMAADPLGVTG